MGNSRRGISVVIPAFNEGANLPRTLERVAEYLGENGWDYEIIVVDDGSKDATASVAEAAAARNPRVSLLRNERNRGKGYSVRRGMLAATRSLRLFSDADLSTPIEELEKLLPWLEQGFDVVIGSRDVPDSIVERHQSLPRESSGKIFNRIVRIFTDVGDYHDTQCGFKLFTGRAAAIFEKQRLNGFAFDVETIVLAQRMGFRVKEAGVRWRHMPGSRVHFLFSPPRMLGEIVKLRWNLMRKVYD